LGANLCCGSGTNQPDLWSGLISAISSLDHFMGVSEEVGERVRSMARSGLEKESRLDCRKNFRIIRIQDENDRKTQEGLGNLYLRLPLATSTASPAPLPPHSLLHAHLPGLPYLATESLWHFHCVPSSRSYCCCWGWGDPGPTQSHSPEAEGWGVSSPPRDYERLGP
jgi:hypothetical protein